MIESQESHEHLPPSQSLTRTRENGPTAVVSSIAWAIKNHLGTGAVASLRRLVPEDPVNPAFFRIAAQYLEPGGHVSGEGSHRDLLEARWSCIIGGLAILGNLYQPGKSLGEALADAGFSELRFVRLLKSQNAGLWDATRRVASFLSSKGQTVDWADMASLVLSDGTDKADSVRRHIARRYYAKLLKTQEGEPKK